MDIDKLIQYTAYVYNGTGFSSLMDIDKLILIVQERRRQILF